MSETIKCEDCYDTNMVKAGKLVDGRDYYRCPNCGLEEAEE